VYLNALLELLTALLEYFDLFTKIYCNYKSLITIIITNAVGINGMRAGDGKQGMLTDLMSKFCLNRDTVDQSTNFGTMTP